MLTRDFPSRITRLAVILSVSLFALCIAGLLLGAAPDATAASTLAAILTAVRPLMLLCTSI